MTKDDGSLGGRRVRTRLVATVVVLTGFVMGAGYVLLYASVMPQQMRSVAGFLAFATFIGGVLALEQKYVGPTAKWYRCIGGGILGAFMGVVWSWQLSGIGILAVILAVLAYFGDTWIRRM